MALNYTTTPTGKSKTSTTYTDPNTGEISNAPRGKHFILNEDGSLVGTFSNDAVGGAGTGDTASYDTYSQERGLAAETLAGLNKQVDVAGQAIPSIQKAGEAGLSAARRQAAGQLASYRGLSEGGRGMSLGRGAAATAGITEAGITAKTAADVQQANADLAEARTQAALQKKTMLESEKVDLQSGIDAASDANAMVTALGNSVSVYVNSSDVGTLRNNLIAKMRAAPSAAAKQAYQDMIDRIDNDTLDVPGAIDMWSSREIPKIG